MKSYIEDPTISRTAAIEFDRVWARIERRVAGGAWFFQARAQVLAEEIPDISHAFGQEVAQRVQSTIQRREPPVIRSPHVAAIVAGDRGLRGIINRWGFRAFGVRLV